MQVRTIAESAQAMQNLANKPLPSKTAYKVGKAIHKVNSIMKKFEKDRMALFEQLGTMQDDGVNINIDPEKQSEFKKNFEALLDEETSIENLLTIDLSEFDGILIEPSILAALDWLIVCEQD
jgi:hypothetical protein